METVEPAFGQIKQSGASAVPPQGLLICAGHNLLNLLRFGTKLGA